MAVKEDVRKLLERLIRTIEPESRLLSFGSTANGFSLRNSGGTQGSIDSSSHLKSFPIDMDLCCLIDSEERLSATDLVTMLGDLLERGQTRPISHSRPLLLIVFFQKRNFTSSRYPMPVYQS
jgi:terminal uridylyltransferase